jgi:hypothetical protein
MDLDPTSAVRQLLAGYMSHAGDCGKHHLLKALRMESQPGFSSSGSSRRQLLIALQKQLASDGCAAFYRSSLSIKELMSLHSDYPVRNRQVNHCLLDQAKIFLESLLRTTNPAILKLLLERTINLVSVTELQSIPLSILEGFKEIPHNCLRTLIDTKAILVRVATSVQYLLSTVSNHLISHVIKLH